MGKEKKSKSPRKRAKRLLRNLFLVLLLAAVAFFAYIWFTPMSERDVWDFVPEDAVFVLEADDPIENWEDLSSTPMWKHIKKNELFADIEGDANFLDTLISDNKKLFNLISGKKLLLVAQMTQAEDYDFVYLMDLQKGAKVSFFMDIFKPVLSAAGYPMTKQELAGETIYAINDGSDDILLGFQDNVLIASYSKKLLLGVLEQQKKPFYSRNSEFIPIRKGAYKQENRSSIAKVHLNFDQLDEYMGVFMDEVSGSVMDLSTSLGYTSFDIKVDDDFIELSGMVSADTSVKSLSTVLLRQKRSDVLAPKVLPTNTSFVLTIDYHDFDYFYESISELMQEEEGYKDFEKTKNTIGKLLGVDKSDKKKERAEKRGKDKDYFDWLGQEIALAMVPTNEDGSKQAYVCLIHTPDYANAFHDLEKIARQVRRRTPVKFKDYEYRGKNIRYLAMKGFFRLFMGKLFKQFDQPKYVVLDEFVVFSNDTTGIHRIIDASLADEALYGEENYRRVSRKFNDRSNYFIYANTRSLYPHLPSLLDAESARDLRKNKNYILSFPYMGMQLTSDDERFDAEIYLEFDKQE